MSTTDAQREQEQVIGTLTGIVQKGPDKWQAVVQPDGSQYTKNLWTKDAPLVGTLSTMIGQRLALLCNASHWNMQDGTPVRSLWIEAAGPPTVGSPALQGPPQQPQNAWEQAQQAQQQASNLPPQQMTATVQPQPSNAITPEMAADLRAVGAVPFEQPQKDAREQRIHRQTASKVAAIMLTHVTAEERTMTNLLVLAERLVSYYNNGLPQNPQTLDELTALAMPQGMGEEPLRGNEGVPHGDDDIPF